MRSSLLNPRVCESILLIWSLLAIRCFAGECETHGSCYVEPEGSGAQTGVDWNNAYADLPASLTRGVTYFLAGSATRYAKHVFNDADSGTTAITIYKAVDCSVTPTAPYCATINPASAAGWKASFGTVPANWTDPSQIDPETNTGSNWVFCKDYYTVDGVTGTTDPVTGPSGQGFVVNTQNKKIDGIINIGDCALISGITNVSLSHLDVGGTGPMPYFPAAVAACSYSAGRATITIRSSLNGVVDDTISGWTNPGKIIFLGTANTSIGSAQVVVPLASSPCATLAYVALDFTPPGGIFAIDRTNTSAMFTNITIQNSYIHDVVEAITFWGAYNVQILHNYLTRNRSTPTQHASMVQFSEGTNSTVSGPATVAYNFILDAVGTGTIEHLGQPTGCRSNCGTISGLYVYGNVITCDAGTALFTTPQCGTGHGTVSDNSGENNVQNLLFYNNTMADMPGPTGALLLSPKSTGGLFYNNLFYNISGANAARLEANSSRPDSDHGYNTMLNSALLYYETCQVNEYCTTSGSSDPFINDAKYNFKLTADMSSASTSGKVSARGLSLPAPYNVDFDGLQRGADGTWERGAYEYNRDVTKQYPNTRQQTTGH
jgi:hypothetical protein